MPIVQIGEQNPLTDGRQSDKAQAIQCGMVRYFENIGYSVLAEFPLANGRRADLLALDRKGCFTIVEIKSSVEDFRADRKWEEYLQYCDYYLFATGPDVPSDIFPANEGLYVADPYGACVIREPVENKMTAPGRKALTLRFARLAARRAQSVSQYAVSKLGSLPAIDDGTDHEF